MRDYAPNEGPAVASAFAAVLDAAQAFHDAMNRLDEVGGAARVAATAEPGRLFHQVKPLISARQRIDDALQPLMRRTSRTMDFGPGRRR